ncbi:hypothetical protein [Chloroflexus sp.]|uniref:hypothetical protein n=1 Tax=Chloroflexus sp. TaxID=1904827 RepID=UPI00262CEFC0|nr:hypothetical protein [uncultured Chloroflexus sp.]
MLNWIAATDRWLLGIVGGSILLIIVAVVVVFTRANPEYRSGSNPDDVVFNYILALERGDYERAYSFLSPALPGYPRSAQAMRQQLQRPFPSEEDVSYDIASVTINGDQATVTAREIVIYRGSGLFGGGQSTSTYTFELQQTPDGWRLIGSSNWRVWQWCWTQEGGC